MDANEVARYLQNHPEFFEQYADLLAQLHIPSPHEGRAISITERQIVALRDKGKQLESKLAELIRFGEENDAIAEKVHRLSVALAGATDLAAVLRTLYSHLGGAFAVPHVGLRLWAGRGDGSEFAAVPESERQFAARLAHPYCGPAAGQDAAGWFGERGAQVRSIAQLPVRVVGQTIGLLVLGSEEPHRFYPEMGTLYLERIAEVASAALARAVLLQPS